MQVFVVRTTLPGSIGDLREQVRFHGPTDATVFGRSDLEVLATESEVDWSVPRHVMVGDVILFQISANARRRAAKLRRAIDALPDDDPDYVGMAFGLEAAEKFAGCIIAVGRVAGKAYFDSAGAHFSGRYYARVVDLHPVWLRVVGEQPYCAWPEFMPHGPVAYRQFARDDRYRELLAALDETADSPVPAWARERTLTAQQNVEVTRRNWMNLARRSEFGFALEAAVHHYYADWLLRDLSDRRVLYDEVAVLADGVPVGRVDNVILGNGVPVPVEVKIAAGTEPRLFEQLDRYRDASGLATRKRRLSDRRHDVVLVVDQDGIYITDRATESLPEPAIRRQETTRKAILDLRRQLESVVGASSG